MEPIDSMCEIHLCVCPLFEQIFHDHRTIAGLNEVMPCRDPSSHDAQRYHHHLQAGGISPQPWERTGHEDHEEIPPIYDPYPIFCAFWRTWRSSGCSGIRCVASHQPRSQIQNPLKLRRLKIRKSRTKRTARMKPGDSGSDSQRPNDSTAARHAAPMAFPTLFRAKITSGSSNRRSSQVQKWQISVHPGPLTFKGCNPSISGNGVRSSFEFSLCSTSTRSEVLQFHTCQRDQQFWNQVKHCLDCHLIHLNTALNAASIG